jgi:hypothetical protein
MTSATDAAGRDQPDGAPGTPAAGLEPSDDLVSTAHTLIAGSRTLRYTAATGRLVLREESHTDEAFHGHKPTADLPYEAVTDRVAPWSYKEFEGRHVHVADKLSAAMRANPHLRVYVAAGYHDGATPYFAAEHTVAHLHIPAQLRGNLEFAYFEAGHSPTSRPGT